MVFLCVILVGKIFMEEKVLEGEIMTLEEVKKSRAQRDALDFLLSPRGMDLMAECISSYLFSRRTPK